MHSLTISEDLDALILSLYFPCVKLGCKNFSNIILELVVWTGDGLMQAPIKLQFLRRKHVKFVKVCSRVFNNDIYIAFPFYICPVLVGSLEKNVDTISKSCF